MAGARVAVAHKLSMILHRMSADGSGLRWGKQATTGHERFQSPPEEAKVLATQRLECLRRGGDLVEAMTRSE